METIISWEKKGRPRVRSGYLVVLLFKIITYTKSMLTAEEKTGYDSKQYYFDHNNNKIS